MRSAGCTDQGIESTVDIEGIGRGEGRALRNPVTDEPHEAHTTLPDGFIWTDGNCGVGSYNASTEGVELEFTDTNWIHYQLDWSN